MTHFPRDLARQLRTRLQTLRRLRDMRPHSNLRRLTVFTLGTFAILLASVFPHAAHADDPPVADDIIEIGAINGITLNDE